MLAVSEKSILDRPDQRLLVEGDGADVAGRMTRRRTPRIERPLEAVGGPSALPGQEGDGGLPAEPGEVITPRPVMLEPIDLRHTVRPGRSEVMALSGRASVAKGAGI